MLNKKMVAVFLTLVLLAGTLVAFTEKTDAISIFGDDKGEEEAVKIKEEFNPPQTLEDWAKIIKKQHRGTIINLAWASHPSTDAFKKMTDEFTELTGIEVKWDEMEEQFSHDKLVTEHEANTGRYDVYMMGVTWLGEFAEKGIVIPLDEYLSDEYKTPSWFEYKDIVPAYRKGLGQYEGKVYGIPSAGESAFIAYRKDIFEKHNIDPDSIKTYEDLLEAAKKLHNPEEDLYGIAMRGKRGHHLDYAWFQFLYPFGGRVLEEDGKKAAINKKGGVESLKYYVKLMQYAPPGVENFSHEEATHYFMEGKTALWYDATALAPWIENEEKCTVTDKVGYMAPPKGPEGRYAALAGWNLAIPKNSTKKDAAWAYIMYMTSKLKAKEYVNKGGVVTRTSVLTDSDLQEEYRYFDEINKTLKFATRLVEKGVEWRPRIPQWGEIGDILGDQGILALVGEKDSEDAVNDAAEQINQVMLE